MKVVLGTMPFGGQLNETDSDKMLTLFHDYNCGDDGSGGHSIELDTAYMYTDGKSEQIIGKLLEKNNYKKKLYIATKAHPSNGGLTPESVRNQLETSLSRLNLPCVDLFYLHAPDHNNPILDTLRACNELHKEGKFKELGLSNYSSWQVADIWHICNHNNWIKPTVYQGMYNVLTRNIEKELFPAIRNFGIKFYAYNPIAGGLLSGKYVKEENPTEGRFKSGTKFGDMYKDRYWKDSYFKAMEHISSTVETYNKTSGEHLTLVEVAFSWLHHSTLKASSGDAIILGASKISHLEDNLKHIQSKPLPDVILKSCQDAWNICAADCPNYYR